MPALGQSPPTFFLSEPLSPDPADRPPAGSRPTARLDGNGTGQALWFR